jgi:hypothetical protein
LAEISGDVHCVISLLPIKGFPVTGIACLYDVSVEGCQGRQRDIRPVVSGEDVKELYYIVGSREVQGMKNKQGLQILFDTLLGVETYGAEWAVLYQG